MQLDAVVAFCFDLAESATIADLEYLLADVPARSRDLKTLCRGAEDMLASLGHCWSAIISNRLLKLPRYRRLRQALLDALTAAADGCRS
jgi:hypothetical protein